MKVVYSPTALRQIELQLAYIIGRGGEAAAKRLRRRISDHIRRFLVLYPRTGRFIDQHDLYEAWIPKTRFVVFYGIADDVLRIYALFHTSQDRADFDREDGGEAWSSPKS